MFNDYAEKVCKRLSTLKALRTPHEDVWRRCFRYTYPLRGNGLSGEVIDAESGANQKSKQTDSTGTESVRTLASAIMSGLTPANSRWFELDRGEAEGDEDKRYLADAADIIWKNVHASNFDCEAYEGVIDAVCAGWFVLYIDEAKEGGYEFQLWPIGQCFVSSSKAGGIVDTIYRCYELSAEQAVSEFGFNKVSDDIRKAVDGGRADEKFEFVHSIEPRQMYVAGARLAKNLPFASHHVEVKKKHTVRESGYHEFPCVVPRWQLLPGTCYAVGPVFDALPDIAMLNDVRALEYMNLDMAIGGMWIAEDDGVLNPRSVKIGPRKVIVANSVDSMKQLTSGTDFKLAFMSEDRIQAQIRKILLADQLQPQDGPAMTATEVHARINLIRQLLGPIYGRLQSEYLKPMIERCFGIAYRAGALGPAPESLRRREFRVKFISPLARAQRLEEVAAIDQYVAGLLAVAESTQDPSIMDNVDLDAAAKFKGEALGVPQQIIPKAPDIEKRRRARAQAQQQAVEQEQQMQLQQAAGEASIKKTVA